MPDMREKVVEYIKELNDEIEGISKWMEEYPNPNKHYFDLMASRLDALIDVRTDLQNRLEELV